MKKFFVFLSVMAIAATSANAQNANFGLKAGMTASNMKFTGGDNLGGFSVNASTKIGFYAGVISELNVAEDFAIQPELYYSLLGAKAKGDIASGKLDLSYVSLPVLAKYTHDGFSAFAGPQIGYLISSKTKANGQTEDIKDEMNSIDFSGVIGLGYTLPNGFGLDARYQAGIANIAKESEGGKAINNAFMVGIHYFFNKQAAY